MSKTYRRIVGIVVILIVTVLTSGSSALAGDVAGEEKLINVLTAYLNRTVHDSNVRRDLNVTRTEARELDGPMGYEAAHALAELEKDYPHSAKALPLIKRLVSDSDPIVRCKAARVLGVLHADVNDADIKAICALLKSTDTKEVEDGLKALRGLQAPSAVPEILPVLKSSDTHNIRDACRTLAILGNKEAVPSLEPLLKHSDAAVRKDAQSAIEALRAKS